MLDLSDLTLIVKFDDIHKFKKKMKPLNLEKCEHGVPKGTFSFMPEFRRKSIMKLQYSIVIIVLIES